MRQLLFRARMSLGWGEHPNQLRANRDAVWRTLPVLVVLLLVSCALFSGVIFVGDESHHRPASLPEVTRESVPLWIVVTTLYLLFVLQSVWWGQVARRRTAASMASVYGRCFQTLPSPPRNLFARIGPAREAARWYALPLDWDEVVAPGDAEYELTVNPGTGWVERVRRLGAAPTEVSQEPPVILTGEAARSQAEEVRQAFLVQWQGDATKEERQAFKRFARAQPLGWRAENWTYGAAGWAMVVFGTVTGAGWATTVAVLMAIVPQSIRHPGYDQSLIISAAVMLAIGAAIVVPGIYWLRAWRRWRPFRNEESVSAEGAVEAWKPYRDLYSPSDTHQIKETLILLRYADGTSHIFRIPVKFAHRVRERRRMVRIEYRPTTDRVVDVHQVEAASPVEANT